MPAHVQAKQVQKSDVSRSENIQRTSAKRQLNRKKNNVAPAYLQAKLNISAADDPLEREADQVADNVMRLPVQRTSDTAARTINRASLKPGITPLNRNENISRDTLKPGEQEIQRASLKPGDEAIQRQSDINVPQVSDGVETRINSKRGQGEAMSPALLSEMESRFAEDFSAVRIHTDADASEMSQDIQAKAFTVGNDVFFASGYFDANSDEGKRLLAHELTHVVQQNGSVETAERKVQRFSLRGAWNSVTSAVGSAVDFVGDTLAAGLRWIKNKLKDLVSNLPGYSLLGVMLGADPITGASITRNGRNFIEAGLDVMPNGEALKTKLEENGALSEAAQWLDEQIENLNFKPSAIVKQLGDFFGSLSLSDIRSPGSVFTRLKNIVLPPISRLVLFAKNVAFKLLQIIKNYILDSLVSFIKERTRAYPLLTVILAKDPITDEEVDRTPIALLRGFMMLSESGEEQLRQMEESGSLQKAADWLDKTVSRLNISWPVIKQVFIDIWNVFTFENLFPNPFVAFQKVVGILAPPALRIVEFIVVVGLKILGLIKDALIRRLIAFAKRIPGYELLTVILARDPFSGEEVPRTTENIIRGFMLLIPGGEEQFNQMKETGAIARMSERIDTAMAALNFTWEYIRGLFTKAWESFTLSMLAAPIQAFMRIMDIFVDPLRRLLSFVIEIIKVVIEVVLRLMEFPINLVNRIITKAMEAFDNIKRNPIGFLKNLLRAVRQGFEQFFGKIAEHLVGGLVDWLFGELSEAGITPPQDLSFRSILGMVLEVLGITIERIWEKLAERIGPEKVARIRGMIDQLSGAWSFIKDVVTRGPIAIWEYIQEKLSNLWDTVFEAIRNWIVTRIVQQVTAKLLSMLDPTGIMTVVNGFIAFFKAIQSFIRYLREMLEIVASFVEGVAEIAAGSVMGAANYLENALARAVPIAIGFLANQVGLGGLGRRIGEMIGRVREMVDRGLTWLIDKAVTAGSALLNMGRSALASVGNWWRKRKRIQTRSGEAHTLYTTGGSNNLRFMVASSPKDYATFLTEINIVDNDPRKTEKQTAKTRAQTIYSELVVLSNTLSQSNAEQQSQNNQSADFDVKLDQLAEQTAILMDGAGGEGNIPLSSPPVYGGLTSAGYATSMYVPRLTSTGPAGSGPSVPHGAHYAKLNQRRTSSGAASFYIKGHLLNDNVHGPGNTWRNLTPLTRWANNTDSDSHLNAIEKYVKDEVNIKKRIVEYRVTAVYGRSVNSSLLAELEQGTDPNKEIKKQIILEEALVPSKLATEANIIGTTQQGDDINVPQQIKKVDINNSKRIDTSLDQYYVNGESGAPVSEPKKVGVNFERRNSNKDEAVKALSSKIVPGIGEDRANLILETPGARNFSSWDAMRSRIQTYTDNQSATTRIYNALANNDKVTLRGNTEWE